ncbi:MAG: NADH-quinone oxidoreductase subunit L [Thermoplasmatota archaeon]
MTFVSLAWLIPTLPFIAFVLILFFGLWTPQKGGWVAVVLVGLAGLLSLGVFWDVWLGKQGAYGSPYVQQISWFSIPRLNAGAAPYEIFAGVYIDPLTAFMVAIVGVLVTLIVVYSLGYMHAEGDQRHRYYAEIALFITGMLGFVLASDYLQMFMFWEIMGLCSYLLIGYWYKRPAAAAAAKKAFLVTRIGDAFFFVGLAILLVNFGTLDFNKLFAMRATAAQHGWLLLANTCLFLGAVGKSAQFPLHVWLPDAMEGPTTVSALIHAATMVKAGVYLVARSYPLFVQTPELLVVVAVIGAFTALFAASMALVNNDLKRVLAYSTLSQLGYMFLGLGVAGVAWTSNDPTKVAEVALLAISVGLFHLFSHAFFKAGLFLSAGSVGHALHHHASPYDMRVMGGLRKAMPITSIAMLLCTLSIAGFPFFSGFYSKDMLLGTVWKAYAADGSLLWLILWAVGILTALMTAFYMMRLYLMTFEGDYRWPRFKDQFTTASTLQEEDEEPVGETSHGHDAASAKAEAHAGEPEDHYHKHLHESPPSMTSVLVLLAIFAVFGGIALILAFGGGPQGFIHGDSQTENILGAASAGPDSTGVAALLEPFTEWQTWVALAAMAAGFALAWTWYRPSEVENNLRSDAQYTGFARVLYHRYYIDNVYNAAAETVVVGFANLERWFDENIVDGAVNGIGWAGASLARVGRRMQSGNAQDYAMVLVGGLILVILLVIYVPELPNFFGHLQSLGLPIPGGS